MHKYLGVCIRSDFEEALIFSFYCILSYLNGKLYSKPKKIVIKSTVDEANTYINQLYTSLNVDEISINTIRMNVVGAMIPSGTWDIITSKTYSDYGYQIAMSFAKGGIRFRKLSGGIWSDWDAYVQISDLESIQNDIKIYRISQTSFASILKNRLNKITFFGFYQPTDNPFSFSAGYAMAFNSSIINDSHEFCFIGTNGNGTAFETKLLTISG